MTVRDFHGVEGKHLNFNLSGIAIPNLRTAESFLRLLLVRIER
ncbi:MAG: hypothetical protein R3B95_10905 [Nitrospirales bacterium]